jgi:hypothetical protein
MSMSLMGQKRRFECVSATSVLPPKADVRLPRNDRRNRPGAEVVPRVAILEALPAGGA